MPKTYATLYLPYHKQGDDLHKSLVKEGGKVNSKVTLSNHIRLLQESIDKLQALHDALQDDDNVELDGDTHHISVMGDKEAIERLLEKNLVERDDEYWGESEEKD
jgi:hypothetical protein